MVRERMRDIVQIDQKSTDTGTVQESQSTKHSQLSNQSLGRLTRPARGIGRESEWPTGQCRSSTIGCIAQLYFSSAWWGVGGNVEYHSSNVKAYFSCSQKERGPIRLNSAENGWSQREQNITE